MFLYILKRLVSMIPTLLGITLLTFILISLAPGDPVANSFGAGGGDSPSADGGGGESRDKMADAIKAKKRLLGMVTEDYAVGSWSTSVAAPAPREDGFEAATPMIPTQMLGELEAWLRALAPVPGSSTYYAAGNDGQIFKMDAQSGAVAKSVQGHEKAIWALTLSDDGKMLASSDIEGRIRFWQVDGLSQSGEVEGNGKPARSMAFTPDGKMLIVASDDSIIRKIDVAGQKVVQEYADHVAGVYAIAMAENGKQFWSGGYDRTLRLWDIDSGEIVVKAENHPQGINDILLVAGGKRLITACDDRKIHVFDVDGKSALTEAGVLEGHYREVTAVALTQDGKTLYSGSKDEDLRSWDLANLSLLGKSAAQAGRMHDLAISGDGQTILSAAASWREVPIATRYIRWLGRIATLDFDRSFIDDEPVIDKIAKALPVTLLLNFIAIFLIYGISLPVGIYAAVRRGKLFDNISSLVLFVLYSIPNFWLATMLIMMFSSKKRWNIFPSVGMHDINAIDLSYFQWLSDAGMHMVLPITVMVYAGFARLSRYVRTTMLETIQADYVRTARAKGLTEKVVVLKHAFRNSLITIVTLVANLLPAMIGGSVIIEFIFSIDGMGKLGFDAILSRDYPVIMAITTFSAFLTLFGILVSDLLYSVVDPRVTVEK